MKSILVIFFHHLNNHKVGNTPWHHSFVSFLCYFGDYNLKATDFRYILALFSFLALYQCCVWNTWGPVVNSVQVGSLEDQFLEYYYYQYWSIFGMVIGLIDWSTLQCIGVWSGMIWMVSQCIFQTVYGWDTATVSLFANWGSIAFLAFMVPILYLQVLWDNITHVTIAWKS